MNYIYSKVSREKNFFGNSDPVKLSENFGTPLYIYNEDLLRSRCRDLKGLISYSNFTVNYSQNQENKISWEETAL
jgi:diaminopimelate decarboxylase